MNKIEFFLLQKNDFESKYKIFIDGKEDGEFSVSTNDGVAKVSCEAGKYKTRGLTGVILLKEILNYALINPSGTGEVNRAEFCLQDDEHYIDSFIDEFGFLIDGEKSDGTSKCYYVKKGLNS
ncbi:MAG: hypothetical protein U0M66_05385 [Bacilli bacterium]|nr:hypothetical protein [Bacilli bacterium]